MGTIGTTDISPPPILPSLLKWNAFLIFLPLFTLFLPVSPFPLCVPSSQDPGCYGCSLHADSWEGVYVVGKLGCRSWGRGWGEKEVGGGRLRRPRLVSGSEGTGAALGLTENLSGDFGPIDSKTLVTKAVQHVHLSGQVTFSFYPLAQTQSTWDQEHRPAKIQAGLSRRKFPNWIQS